MLASGSGKQLLKWVGDPAPPKAAAAAAAAGGAAADPVGPEAAPAQGRPEDAVAAGDRMQVRDQQITARMLPCVWTYRDRSLEKD